MLQFKLLSDLNRSIISFECINSYEYNKFSFSIFDQSLAVILLLIKRRYSMKNFLNYSTLLIKQEVEPL